MEISHSKPEAEPEPEPRSFDPKLRALVYYSVTKPTITTETHLLELVSEMGAWSRGNKKDASCWGRKICD